MPKPLGVLSRGRRWGGLWGCEQRSPAQSQEESASGSFKQFHRKRAEFFHTSIWDSAGQKSDQPLLLTYNVTGRHVSLLHPHPIPTLIPYLCLLFGSRIFYQKWVLGDLNYQLAITALIWKPCAGKASTTGINGIAVPVPSWVCWEAGHQRCMLPLRESHGD